MADQLMLDVFGSCPAGDCRYGGPAAGPICHTYCGAQTGSVWASIDETLSWPDRNAEYERRCRDELMPLKALA